MPTLLTVNNYFYPRGGAETVFLGHSRMLESLGWQVVPFSMHHPMNLPTPWSQYFVDEIEFGKQYSLGEKLVRASRVVYSRQARHNLARLLRKIRPDVCHAHNIYHHISPSILSLLQSRGIPVVLTLHDLKIACPNYQMLASDGICERCRGGRVHNVLVHRCIKDSVALSALIMLEAVVHQWLGSYRRFVDRFVVPSRFYIRKLSEWGFSADRFRYVPNAVAIHRYEPSYEAGSGILYFGRLSREKGLETLIRAAAIAGCPLAIAGAGSELDYLRGLSAKLGANVQFLGFLTGAELNTAIRRARAVVLPSEWYENAPMSVLEAYALGRPVIGSRIGGIPELIRDCETGYLFESGNAEDLANALRIVQEQPSSVLSEMGRQGRLWVEQEFTIENYQERVLSVYRELGIDDGRPNARLA